MLLIGQQTGRVFGAEKNTLAMWVFERFPQYVYETFRDQISASETNTVLRQSLKDEHWTLRSHMSFLN